MVPLVAMMVLTYHKDAPVLDIFLRSAAIFWPKSWEVVLLLDSPESEGDAALVRRLPHWVLVRYVPKPADYAHWPVLSRSRGYSWAQYVPLWYDRYTKARYVAHFDTDVVLWSFAQQQLIFDGAKPLVFGNENRLGLFSSAVQAIGLEVRANFMESLPFVVHRRHFADFRSFLRARVDAPLEEEGFGRLVRLMAQRVECSASQAAQDLDCLPCWQAMMGSFLYKHHFTEYTWAVLPDLNVVKQLIDWCGEVHCPGLFGAAHFPYWAMFARQASGNSSMASMGLEAYEELARYVVRVGICAAHVAYEDSLVECRGPFELPNMWPAKFSSDEKSGRMTSDAVKDVPFSLRLQSEKQNALELWLELTAAGHWHCYNHAYDLEQVCYGDGSKRLHFSKDVSKDFFYTVFNESILGIAPKNYCEQRCLSRSLGSWQWKAWQGLRRERLAAPQALRLLRSFEQNIFTTS